MDEPSLEQIAQRLWAEHKYAVLARSKEAAAEIGSLVGHGERDPAQVVARIVDAMALSESNLAEAVADAWQHLLPRVGSAAREAVRLVLARSPDQARWLVGAVAERVGDAVVAASRLFDHPGSADRLWLRDHLGPTMYVVRGETPVRIPPAEVGGLLSEAFGDVAPATLERVATEPRSPGALRKELGPAAPKVLEAAHRMLVLRRTAGLYHSRGDALRVVLAGMGVG